MGWRSTTGVPSRSPPSTSASTSAPWYAAGEVTLPGAVLGAASLAMPALDPEQALLLRIRAVQR